MWLRERRKCSDGIRTVAGSKKSLFAGVHLGKMSRLKGETFTKLYKTSIYVIPAPDEDVRRQDFLAPFDKGGYRGFLIVE
jgi:hypothetical protein